eukprot:tig00020908_g15301.t1
MDTAFLSLAICNCLGRGPGPGGLAPALPAKHGADQAPCPCPAAALKRPRARGAVRPVPTFSATTDEDDEADERPYPSRPRPYPSRPPPAPHPALSPPPCYAPLPPAPPLPPALPLPPPSPPPLIISLNTRREDSVLEEAGYLDSLLSAFTRSAPAENRSSVSELLSSAEKKFWDLFVSSEAGELSFGR